MVSTASGPRPRRKYDNSRRRAEAGARQRRIIDEATRLFVDQGFGATSVDQIASAADVSAPTLYSTFGSKAGVLAGAIDVAVAGDYEDTPLVDRLMTHIDESGTRRTRRFAKIAAFIRALNERVAPLVRVMDQAASTDSTLEELRARELRAIQSDSRAVVEKYWPAELRPDLSVAEAADTTAMLLSPQVYSMLTADLGWSPDRYEEWLADALPRLILAPESRWE